MVIEISAGHNTAFFRVQQSNEIPRNAGVYSPDTAITSLKN
jgi:hypothetical protein